MTTLDVLRAAVALAAAIIAILLGTRLLRWAMAVLPFSSDQRAGARRWLPAVQLFFGIAVLVLVAVFSLGPTPGLVVAAAAALLTAGAAWFAIRDLVAGVVLRAEHDLQPGYAIRTDEAAGRVHRVGTRSVEIEGSDGQRIRLPYARLVGAPLSVSRPREGGGALRFTVTVPRRSGGRDDIATIRAAALHTFFTSARREPHIRPAAEDALARSYDVTVYAADPAFLPAIEETVNESLSAPSS
ncbi:hypothetical protein BH23GEM9_BH23GEM9_31650 [soil metagenome]